MAVEVRIGGVVYRATNEYMVRNQAGAVSTSTIDVVVGTNPVPRAYQQAQILFDGVPAFWGIIQTVDTPAFSSGFEVKRYSLQISSGAILFQNRLVAESYEGVYTHEIVADLYSKYLEAEGVTLGTISTTDRYFESYTASYEKLADVLQDLADELGASFDISPTKEFFFVTRDDFEECDPPAEIAELKRSEQVGDMRSVQIITGATEETSTQTRGVYWADGQAEQVLAYSLSQEPNVLINGVAANVGVRGVDDSDTSITFLWEYGSPVVSVNADAITKPATGDLVTFVYLGFYDILVVNTNDQLVADLAARSGTTGRIERILTDESITNYQDADTKGAGLLDAYSEEEREVSLFCKDVDASRLYLMWDLAYTSLGIEGLYVVVEQTIQHYYDGAYKVSVKMKNRNFYCRYGQSFRRYEKKVGGSKLVYKNSAIGDIATANDEYSFATAGTVFYATAGDYTDPMLPGFYPV